MDKTEVDMEVENQEGNIVRTESIRARTKKKSTLTKLKERKQRELGSLTSLQSLSNGDVNAVENNKKEESQPAQGETSPSTQPDVHHFSTKDSVESRTAPEPDRRPKPKPRARRLSDASGENFKLQNDKIRDQGQSLDEKQNLAKQDSTNSDGATLQMFKNLKMAGDLPESVDSVVGHSGFLPKPPATPRTPRSNPRTPRAYLSGGKGEKRLREPGSSGDEREVGEKKEKSASLSDRQDSEDRDNAKTSIGSLTEIQTTNGAITNSERNSTRRIPGQPKHGERLLKRRSSKDTVAAVNGQDDKQTPRDPGKPPMNRSSANSNNHNINNNGNSSSIIASAKVDELVMFESPRDKYLKSANRSRSKSPSSHRKSSTSNLEPKSSPDHVSIASSPGHRSANGNGAGSNSDLKNETIDALQMNYEQILLADMDNSNKSTQVLFTSEPPLSVRSISSPPTSARLDPISPKSHPPPLPEDFASHSLRTAYKSDLNVRPGTASGPSMAKSDSGSGERLSQKSFASGSVMPVITIKEARSRSLLENGVGNASPTSASFEELERYFPNRKVHILVGTWNMNELKDLNISLDDFILPEKCDYVQDIYAIGTQENAMNKKEWEIKLQETLGPSHVMYHSVSHGSLHLVVYIRRDLIWFCSAPEDDVVSLRAVTMIKTKGAIGISFTLFGTSYLFINCHLTSDRDNAISRKKYRLGDYFKVIQEMRLPKNIQDTSSASKKPADITTIFDCVFWFGDLNFRIERKRHAVEGRVNQINDDEIPNFETLLGGDQLLKYMTEGKIFGGFQEGRINFHPTFKFDVNEDKYDSSAKARVPSYTDRVMFRCKRKSEISCLHYDAAMTIKVSDHRPVFGQFETVIQPGRDSTIYGAGHFDRYVYAEANKRRADKQPVKKKQSVVCTVQ